MLWGKSSKCVMVTKGWFRVSIGVILLSASMVSIFFSRSMNSRRSAFSTNMSLPSKSVVMFTCKQVGTSYQDSAGPPWPHPSYSVLCSSILISWAPLHNPQKAVSALWGVLPRVITAAGHSCSLCRRRWWGLLREERGPCGHLHTYECAGAAGSAFIS